MSEEDTNRKRPAADADTCSSRASKKSKDAPTLITDDLLDRLHCPICLELPKAEVYQCTNGHSVCNNCIVNVKLKNCPTCAVPYPGENGQGIRNRFAEEILSTIRYDCPWKEQGCDLQQMTGQQLTEHQEQCSYNPTPVKLCALLHWGSCPFQVPRDFLRNTSLEPPVDWVNHIRDEHDFNYDSSSIEAGSLSTLHFSRLLMEALFKDGLILIRCPIIRLMNPISGDPVGLFMIWTCNFSSPSDAKQVFWFVVRVTDPPKSCAVRVKFSLKGSRASKDDGDLGCETSWDGQILGLHEFYKFEKSPRELKDRIKFTFSSAQLQKHHLDSDGELDFQYVFNVTPLSNDKPADNSSDNN